MADTALFAELSYRMLDPNTNEENLENINQKLKDENHGDWYISPKYSDRNMITLVNDNTKEVHIAQRGTDSTGVTSKSDIKADVLLGIGMESDSKKFNKRVQRTETILKAVPSEYTVTASGHSLGGKTMGYTMERSKLARGRIDKVDLYNAGASPFQQKIGSGKKKVLDKKVTQHRTSNDLVSASLLVNNPYGTVKTYDTKTSSAMKKSMFIPKGLKQIFNTADALHSHGIFHFKKKK